MVARHSRQAGLTYFWFLLVVFVLALSIGQYLDLQSSLVRRQKEAELVQVGTLYREAIAQYYLSSPNGVYHYPERLEDLLRDPRHVVVRRYLRRLYPDPITGEPFVPIASGIGGIAGVQSRSLTHPIAQPVPGAVISTKQSAGYSSWQFIYQGQ